MSDGPPKGADEGDPASSVDPDRAAGDGEATSDETRVERAAERAAEVVRLPAPTGAVAVVEEADDASEHADRYDVASLPRGTLLGHHVLLGPVTRRSSNATYCAYDPEGDRRVIVKLYHPGGNDQDDQAQALPLVQQANVLARLSHPCVERIHEAGIYGPWVFLATEFIDGLDLRHWMEARDEPFPWPEVLRVFREAGRGLAAAHQAGIVHGDFRPANVLMGKEGRLVVVDFGLAPAVEEQADDIDVSELRDSLVGSSSSADETQPTANEPSGRSGTPAFMAPEQHLEGARADARSDQFSFCVALYEALYGERPFSGNRPRAIALEAVRHNVRPPPPGSNVPAWLRAAVLRGLSPRPEDRFPGMEALLRELARDPAASRRRWAWGAVLATALVASGAVVAERLEADRSVCDGQGDALTEVWTPERRDSIARAFETTGRAWADPTWRYTEAKLDTWAEEWRDLSKRACLATRVWGDAAERTYEVRLACLDRHLDGLQATLEILETIDGPTLDRAHVLAQGLPTPRQCLDTNTLLTLGLPADEQLEEVDAVQGELSGLDAELALGRNAVVVRELTALQPRIETTEDGPSLARSQLLLGRAHLATGSPHAETVLHEAARTALEAGDPRLAMEAWMGRMQALQQEGRVEEALALADYVESMLQSRRFSWMRPTLDVARGDLEHARGHDADALAHYHAAIEHEQARADPDPLRLLPAWRGQARVLMEHGDLDEALPPLQTALDATHDALGPLHPAAIDTLRALGEVERRRGRSSEARALFTHALELVHKTDPDQTDLEVELETAIGSLLAAEGDPERATHHLERALAAAGGREAMEHPAVFRVAVMLARAEHETGDTAGAIELLEAVLAPRRSAGHPLGTSPDPATGTSPPSTADWVDAELLEASLHWATGEPQRARALATGIEAQLHDSAAHQVYRDDVTRWLEEHPAP
ncbi:protein kinase domain-containing protein [Paraliomyxa miuraensis]|uniref:serine/threonine-protein kinase n=1 Tax=Paraliomyxa miuraensis TaxID=376150 RepID=UPI00224F1D45|nr:serine/threonine-protein kinase [Paraliomyxa miuraensis]MCX4243818.1 serine/threonine-protein kinase [Paraliomyxa miuraensis]